MSITWKQFAQAIHIHCPFHKCLWTLSIFFKTAHKKWTVTYPFFSTIPFWSTNGVCSTVRPVYCVVIIIKIHCHCAHRIAKGDNHIRLVWGTKSYPSYIRSRCEQKERLYICKWEESYKAFFLCKHFLCLTPINFAFPVNGFIPRIKLKVIVNFKKGSSKFGIFYQDVFFEDTS